MIKEVESRKVNPSQYLQYAYYTESKLISQEQKKDEKWRMNPIKNFRAKSNYRNFKRNHCSKIEIEAPECRRKIANRKLVHINIRNQ